jgi:hypothetical protein
MIPSKTLDALTEGREGFEYDSKGEFFSCGGEKSMNLLRLHSLYSSLKLELETGMKISARVNTLRIANEMLGTNYKRKQKAFDHLESIMKLAGEIREGV